MYDSTSLRKLRIRCDQLGKARPTLIVNERLLRIHALAFENHSEIKAVPHEHVTYEMILMLDGEAIFERPEVSQLLERGHLFMFEPHTRHAWRVPGAPCFTFVALFSLEPAITIPLPEHWLSYPALADDTELLGHHILEANQQEQLGVVAEVMTIINCAITLISPEKPLLQSAVQKPDLLDEVEQYVLRDLTSWPSLEQIAVQVGMSVRHLTRTFRELSGETLANYVLRCRLNVASTMLLESESKITDICAQTGFTDPSYFFRTFNRLFGNTPKVYRALARHAQRTANEADVLSSPGRI